MMVAAGRHFLPPHSAGRQIELKFALNPTEPDESKIVFEIPKGAFDECLMRMDRTHSAGGVVTIVTEIPD